MTKDAERLLQCIVKKSKEDFLHFPQCLIRLEQDL